MDGGAWGAAVHGVAKSRTRLSNFTPWTAAHQAPLSMEFSRQECWSGLPFLSPGDLPKSGIEPRSPALQADSLPTESPGKQDMGGNKSFYYQFAYKPVSLCYLGHGQ